MKQLAIAFLIFQTLGACRHTAPSSTALLESTSTCIAPKTNIDTFAAEHTVKYEVPTPEIGGATQKTILMAALASRLVYENDGFIKRTSLLWGFNNVDIIVDKSMQAILISNDNCAVLAFRGTDFSSLKDWMVNTRVSQKRVPSGKIHRGFYKAYLSMNKKISSKLKSQNVRGKDFLVTGHSLGGALAGAYAYDNHLDLFLGNSGPEIEHIITFGQPLFADLQLSIALRREFYGRYIRVVNNNDLATRVPYWFTHFGALMWLKDNSVEIKKEGKSFSSTSPGSPSKQIYIPAEIPDSLSSDKEAFESFMNSTQRVTLPNGSPVFGGALEDHTMVHYLGRLSQIL